MKFHPTELQDVFLLEPIPFEDERGTFTRLWCAEQLEARGLEAVLSQASVSGNAVAGTLRGLHYQVEPYAEAKLVRCLRGSLYDVVVDMRSGPTFGQWMGTRLDPAGRRSLYVPPGFAHGYQTLEDNTEVLYMISAPYNPEAARGVRWDDPAFAIEWPEASTRIISERDRSWPDYRP